MGPRSVTNILHFRGGVLFRGCWGSFCRLVFLWVCHQICRGAAKISVSVMRFLMKKVSGYPLLENVLQIMWRDLWPALEWSLIIIAEIKSWLDFCNKYNFQGLWRESWTWLICSAFCPISCLCYSRCPSQVKIPRSWHHQSLLLQGVRVRTRALARWRWGASPRSSASWGSWGSSSWPGTSLGCRHSAWLSRTGQSSDQCCKSVV